MTKADGYVMPKVLIPYEPALEKAGDVRKVAVAMHFAAFNGLGWQYKLANGFYTAPRARRGTTCRRASSRALWARSPWCAPR